MDICRILVFKDVAVIPYNLFLLLPSDKGYAVWKSKFDLQACQSDISTILVCCSHVRTLHSQLVPAQVSYEAFWTRYFFQIQQLQKVRVLLSCVYTKLALVVPWTKMCSASVLLIWVIFVCRRRNVGQNWWKERQNVLKSRYSGMKNLKRVSGNTCSYAEYKFVNCICRL